MPIDTSKDYFVSVVEFDCTERSAEIMRRPRQGPFVVECYLDKPASLEKIKREAKRFVGLGEVRFAKLTFVD